LDAKVKGKLSSWRQKSRWEKQDRKDMTRKEGRKEISTSDETKKEELWEDRDK
jgi:hypothetical protein